MIGNSGSGPVSECLSPHSCVEGEEQEFHIL